jgi:hypothetical protein
MSIVQDLFTSLAPISPSSNTSFSFPYPFINCSRMIAARVSSLAMYTEGQKRIKSRTRAPTVVVPLPEKLGRLRRESSSVHGLRKEWARSRLDLYIGPSNGVQGLVLVAALRPARET